MTLNRKNLFQLWWQRDGSSSGLRLGAACLQGSSAWIVLIEVAITTNRLADVEFILMNVRPSQSRQFCKPQAGSKDEIDQCLEALEQYRGSNFKDIPKDTQNDLVQMVNEAILLSELMSKESK